MAAMTVVFWVATVAFVALAWRTPSFDLHPTSERLALRRIWPNCLGHGCIVCRAGTDFPTLSREVRLSWTVPASVPLFRSSDSVRRCGRSR